MRGKANSSKLPPRPPQQGPLMRRPTPMFGLGQRPGIGPQRPMPPRPAGRPVAPSKDDKKKNPKQNEEDDTFKKLREMSK